MIQLLKDKSLFLFNKFNSRRGFWLMFLVLPSFFFVPLWQFAVSFIIWRVIDSIYLGVYHEFHVHKLLRPRWFFIEFLGYWRIVSGDFQSPLSKITYHWKHHEFYETEKDPTQGKIDLASNPILFCLDMTAPGPYHHVDTSFVKVQDTKLYRFFQKYWAWICLSNIIFWITITSFWTFIAWFIFPMWIWMIIWKTVDWETHKLKMPDKNWLVLLYGSQCWHFYHHANDRIQTETYYGTGLWKWLNIDFYVQKLTFKLIKE